MNFGEELKSAAIVGTARKELKLARAESKLGDTLAKLDSADQEKFLLAAAAAFGLWKNGGTILQTAAPQMTEIALPETKEILTGRLRQILETLLLDREKAALLPEFLTLTAARGRIVPPEILPVILHAEFSPGQTNKGDFRHLLLPVIGNRGKWLARQNDDWRWALIVENGGQIWETGKAGERIFALEYFRLRDAARARKLLQSVWHSESARERQRLLEVLRINLSAADEEFLDGVYRTDKSAEVKRTAFELLANLPASKLSAETTELLSPVLSVKKKLLVKKEIEITLPEDWHEKTVNLKAVARQIFTDTRYFGEKAMALTVGLSLVNPQIWEASLEMNPAGIVALAHRNDWARALLAGFGMAAIRFENKPWFGEILKFDDKFALTLSPLFAWGADSFGWIAKEKLAALMISFGEFKFINWLITNIEFEPANAVELFTKAKVDLKRLAGTDGIADLKTVATLLPIQLIDECLTDFSGPNDRRNLTEYERRRLEEAISILEFRKEYILEFEK